MKGLAKKPAMTKDQIGNAHIRWYRLMPDHSVVAAVTDANGRAGDEFYEWFEKADRRVALDSRGAIRVSTVFLGLDHNHFGSGPPLLFETLVQGGPNDGDMMRYSTWDEAIAGHARMLDAQPSGLSLEQLKAGASTIKKMLGD